MTSKIAILNIEQLKEGVSANARWVSNTSKVEEGLRSVLKLTTEPFELTNISTLQQLNDLMANRPDDLWIFNTHGELFPIPSGWEWKEFFTQLANNMFERGWSVVNVTGEPFYYYWQGSEINRADDETVSSLGIILARAQAGVTSILKAVLMLSGEGMAALQKTNISLREQQSVSRCPLMQNVMPRLIFYGMSDIYGAAVIPIGKGNLLFNGMMSIDVGSSPDYRTDVLFGKIAGAFLVHTLRKTKGPSNTVWQLNDLINTIKNNLRLMLREEKLFGKKGEKKMQKQMENILKLKMFDYQPNTQIKSGSETRFVDFTIEEYSIALEAKVCNSKEDKSRIADQINADIAIYKTRYNNMIFVVYDTGNFIKDPEKWVKGIEANSYSVKVIVV